MKHQISLEVPTVNNPNILRIIDTSEYVNSLPTDCLRLEITVPGFVSTAVLTVTKGFTLNLNSCSLGLQQTGCQYETHPLPDGIYIIRYSVSPNDKVFVEYNHLRMTRAFNTYFSRIGTYDPACCGASQDIKEILRQFGLIRSFLDAAKGKVENRHEPHKGMELFLYAQRLLEKTIFCQ